MEALGIGEGRSIEQGSGVDPAITTLQAAPVKRPLSAYEQMEDVTPNPSPSLFVVPPPFDESSSGDCYFVSSEGIRFKVLRHSLIHATRYFEDFFQDVPPSTSHNDLPSFYFDEKASTLHSLLVVLYPVHTEEFIDVQSMLELIERQEKYAIPDSTMMHAVSVIVGRSYAGPAPVDDVMDVYAIAWSSGYRNEVKHFSRFMHRVDLTDQSIVDRLIRISGSTKSYTALMELRREREAALDGIIEALEPKKHFCLSHSSSDTMFFAFISMIKTAARNALLEPCPTCLDAFEFLGLQGTDEKRTVTWCSTCYSKADKAKLTNQLEAAIERYPQTISMQVYRSPLLIPFST
ncbi:hypothetical protein FS837_000709 [Tulasnella sp. UAMH 9824]|nr:hypothetical protein FS837_000709 [Tulasnella sp. UAMH 9824]